MFQLLKVLPLILFAFIASASEPRVIISPVDHLFIPSGFDNNDNVEVIVTGNFPNPCYIKNMAEVKVINDRILIQVTALKKEDTKNKICDPMNIPFMEVVTIGNLQGGDYQIKVNEGSQYEQNEEMTINVSGSNSVDDHLYPIVEYIDTGFTGGASGDAVILARLPSDCVEFDRVEYLSNKKDTLSVIPILKKVSNVCNEEQRRIEIPVKFDLKKFSHRDLLLFVRSIEGKSVNQLIKK